MDRARFQGRSEVCVSRRSRGGDWEERLTCSWMGEREMSEEMRMGWDEGVVKESSLGTWLVVARPRGSL